MIVVAWGAHVARLVEWGENRGFEIDEMTERAGEVVVVEVEEGLGVLVRY